MKETVQQFGHKPLAEATLNLFHELNIPVNEVNIAGSLNDFLKDEIRVKESEQVGTVTLVGSVDDKVFANGDSDFDYHEVMDEKQKYDGLIILCVELKKTDPTRTFLSNITRALNRSFHTSPVVVLFKYGSHISLANAERMQYKQKWREGEKVGKVSLLRDIRVPNPHSGHLRILNDLKVDRSGSKKVDSFAGLYEYWQSVFDVSILNKKFYEELSNWYFWAIKHVRFPNEPTAEDAHEQNKDLGDMLQEHRATNVIRLLTRLLFVWFIKEKGLIPEELFDLNTLQKDILNEITPYHETGMFKDTNKESVYYKAILQNLFFATLNCPIEASSTDNRERGFRRPKGNYGVTFLMRYEEYFKDKEAFLELVNSKVPFLNGGLFECLDIRGEKENKEDRVWVDGFSDNLPKEHKLIVPDFLFFGVEEHVDLSEDYGLKSKKYKEAAVKGLLNIFDSYKFTITENTPIEEDVALDPELLGKVFENLLASYNPETKTTARKQTGSFYTPREIVNYMVDESLIAYLKNAIEDWGVTEEKLDKKLHQLTSYEETVPFDGNEELHRKIITALSNCTILDPACGSGAFPMGILQKMVHILQKLDPENKVWKEIQEEKAKEEAGRAISEIEDKEERAQRLQEINEAFDERINAPDYARKLFLVENCIYGVDIQPVATQISKLRFFISLVVEQKVGQDKNNNFGIRPLPNLETKFVTANTLIDIKDNSNQTSLYETDKIKKLEAELKQVRSKLFSARTTDTKYKYRQEDERLRNEIAEELKQTGWPNDAADKLASWDPYDQNASSPFFNPEWMFDISDGFDLVIGNPPYITYKGKERVHITDTEFEYLLKRFKNSAEYKVNSYALFIEHATKILTNNGHVNFIIPSTILQNEYLKNIRGFILNDNHLDLLVVFKNSVFEAITDSIIIQIKRGNNRNQTKVLKKDSLNLDHYSNEYQVWDNSIWQKQKASVINLRASKKEIEILELMDQDSEKLDNILNVYVGVVASGIKKFLSDKKENENYKPYILGRDIDNYTLTFQGRYLNFIPEELHSNTDESVYLQPFKLLVRKTGNRLISVLDENQYYTDQSIYNLYPKKEGTPSKIVEVVNVLLNSAVLDFYFNKRMITNPDVFPYIKGIHLKELPIKLDHEFSSSVSLFSKILQFSQKEVFKEVVNALVFELYFKNHLRELNIDVLRILDEDLKEILGNLEFSQISNSEQKNIVDKLQERWSDPENEVRKRINSFPEKSPDILKPILEG